jgi:calcineurin-like phosphoesterase family protein
MSNLVKKYWFSSDYHFGHKNILKYDKRPFKDIEEHDEEIIARHNQVVIQSDDVYYLGDYGLTDSRYLKNIFPRMLGNWYFIKGNHDKSETIALYERFGIYLGEQKRITIQGQEIILNHFGMRVWDKCHKGAWHLYGHSHGGIDYKHEDLDDDTFKLLLDQPTPWYKSMDVCILLNDYYPFELPEIRKIFDKREQMNHH